MYYMYYEHVFVGGKESECILERYARGRLWSLENFNENSFLFSVDLDRPFGQLNRTLNDSRPGMWFRLLDY